MKSTQIRVTNTSKNEVEVDFKDIINKVDLSSKGIIYKFDGETDKRDDNKGKVAYFLRIESVDVIKSINKMIYPYIDLKEYKKPNWIGLIDITINLKAEQVKLIMNPKYYVILTFFYK